MKYIREIPEELQDNETTFKVWVKEQDTFLIVDEIAGKLKKFNLVIRQVGLCEHYNEFDIIKKSDI